MAGGKGRLPPRWFVVTAWHVGNVAAHHEGPAQRQPRSVILGYYEDEDNLVSMAMNGWGTPEPAWWLNLQAFPEAVVELAGGILGATYSAGPRWAASVNGSGSTGAN